MPSRLAASASVFVNKRDLHLNPELPALLVRRLPLILRRL
jgi:hypothetical protein